LFQSSVTSTSLSSHGFRTQRSPSGFVASLLKDIRAERAKITQKDGLRLLFVTKWFVEFFLGVREKEGEPTWKFSTVSELIEQTWVPWVLKRVREANDEKPKQWTELQAGIDCLTQLV
jgi:replication fork protection complex subunit Tof1/Swi1